MKIFKPIIFYEVHNAKERESLEILKMLGYYILSKPGDMYIAVPQNKHKQFIS